MMEELKAPAFIKLVCAVRMYWTDQGQTRKTKSKHNNGTRQDNELKMDDWEHTQVCSTCILKDTRPTKKVCKPGQKNTGKYYCLVLQHCPPELKKELKNLAQWEAAVIDTDIVALLLISRDTMHHKKEQA